jgi:hypothetical protein
MSKAVDGHNTTTTTGTLEANEDILTYTVSDEAIEAAAGIERGTVVTVTMRFCGYPCVAPV